MIFPHNGTRKPSNLSACDDCIKETSRLVLEFETLHRRSYDFANVPL